MILGSLDWERRGKAVISKLPLGLAEAESCWEPLRGIPPAGEEAGVFILSFFFFLIYLFIYLFLGVLGLRFCARAFSSCSEWGPPFIAVRGPLTVAASLVAEHRLQTRRLSRCGSRA